MAYDKVVDSAVLDGYFEDIADAIRDRSETTGTYTPSQMPQAIADIPSDALLRDLLEGDATGDITIDIETLGSMIYITPTNCNSYLTSLSMPNLTTVLGGAENSSRAGISGNSDRFISLSIPECTKFSIPYPNGSANNLVLTSLKQFYAPKLVELYGTLRGTKIINLDLPNLTTFTGAFRNNNSLETVNLPKLQSLTGGMFAYCTPVTEISLPSAAGQFFSSAFEGCTTLKTVILPKVSIAAGSADVFNGDTSLELVDMGNNTASGGAIGNRVFVGCSNLKAIVLRYTSIVNLQLTNAMDNSGIASGTGYIYVPRNQVSTYQQATNWSVYSSQIRAIEDYTDDGTLDGKFIIPN